MDLLQEWYTKKYVTVPTHALLNMISSVWGLLWLSTLVLVSSTVGRCLIAVQAGSIGVTRRVLICIVLVFLGMSDPMGAVVSSEPVLFRK